MAFVVLSLACSVAGAQIPATAEQPASEPPSTNAAAPPEPEVVTRARRLFKRGIASSEAGDWQAGAEAFAQSVALVPMPTALLNLAIARAELQQPTAGLAALKRFSEVAQPGRHASQIRQAETLTARLKGMLARLDLEVSPADARVRLDGTDDTQRGAHRQWLLDPGAHVLQLSAPGHSPQSTTLQLAVSEQRQTTVALVRTPPEQVAPAQAAPAPAAPVPQADTWNPRRKRWVWALSAVAAGAAVAVGGYFLLRPDPEPEPVFQPPVPASADFTF